MDNIRRVLFVLFGITAFFLSGCANNNPKIPENELVISPEKAAWGDTVHIYFRTDRDIDSVWVSFRIEFSDSAEWECIPLARRGKVFSGEYVIPEKSLLIYAFPSFGKKIPVDLLASNWKYIEIDVPVGENSGISMDSLVFLPDSILDKMVRNGDKTELYIHSFVSALRRRDTLWMRKLLDIGFKEKNLPWGVLAGILYNLGEEDSSVKLIKNLPDSLIRQKTIATEYWMQGIDSNMVDEVIDIVRDIIRIQPDVMLNIYVYLFKNNLFNSTQFCEIVKNAANNFHINKFSDLSKLYYLRRLLPVCGDTAKLEEIGDMLYGLLLQNRLQKFILSTPYYNIVTSTILDAYKFRGDPKKTIEVAQFLKSIYEGIKYDASSYIPILSALAESYDAIGDTTNALKNWYLLYVYSTDSTAAQKISELVGKSVSDAVAELSQKFSDGVLIIPKNFRLITFDGDTITYDSLAGRIFVLNFWGTGCKPCIEEFPILNKVQKQLKSWGIPCFAVMPEADNRKIAQKIVQQNPPGYTPCYDDGNILFSKLNITGIPVHIIVDNRGVVRFFRVGSIQNPNDIIAPLTTIISSQPRT
ncbi:MAG: hypothetical protein DRJ64_09515 [Thermoprotei archaeon]|nr:MAG: hypothetical protein DRJ64_09515 [Thermoprotei archaeon]